MEVELHGRTHLFHFARREHNDAVGQGHGLHLVVRDVDHGGLQLLVQLGEFIAHLHAQRRVQVGKRLIEQEHRGLAHDGAADGHALALATREIFRLAVQQVFDVQDARGVAHRRLDFGLGHLGQLQPEGHVVEQVHVRVERVALEHHGDAPLGRCGLVHALTADEEVATGNLFQARDAAQQGAFAAARGADEHHEFAVADLQVDAVQDARGAVGLLDIDEFHIRHGAVSQRWFAISGLDFLGNLHDYAFGMTWM